MRRADRLFQIIQVLQGRRVTTARQLAERLEVSERTIYRDIRDLIGAGVPIDGEAGIGYVLRGGFHLPPLMFRPEEMEALILGARMVDAWCGAELARAAREALAKIEHVLPAELKHSLADSRMFAPAHRDLQTLAPQLDRLRDAINRRCKVRLAYRRADGEDSERIIRPLGLAFWGTVWTLAAWCELRADYRSFRLDRIQKADLLEMGFEETDAISLRGFLSRIGRGPAGGSGA